MKKSDKQWLFLQDVSLLVQYATSQGYKLTGGELWRPDEMQAIYLQDGKTQVKRSNHQDKMAIDLNLFVDGEIQWSKNEDWEKLGKFWCKIRPQNRWGGNYKTLKDPYHFESVY